MAPAELVMPLPADCVPKGTEENTLESVGQGPLQPGLKSGQHCNVVVVVFPSPSSVWSKITSARTFSFVLSWSLLGGSHPSPVAPRTESRRQLRGEGADSDPIAGWHGHLSLPLHPIHLQKGAPHSLPGGGDPTEAENTPSMRDEINGEQQRILHVLVLDVGGW